MISSFTDRRSEKAVTIRAHCLCVCVFVIGTCENNSNLTLLEV